MNESAPAQVNRCVESFRRVYRYMRAGDPDDWTTLSLTMAQLRTLFRLHNEGPLTVGRLAQSLGVTLPSVTGTVDRLVGQGLVERRAEPADRRLVINQLTETGQALIERLQQGRRARLQAVLGELAETDLQTLDRALAAVVDAISAADDRDLPSAPRQTPNTQPAFAGSPQ